jgi:hypothetical protein
MDCACGIAVAPHLRRGWARLMRPHTLATTSWTIGSTSHRRSLVRTNPELPTAVPTYPKLTRVDGDLSHPLIEGSVALRGSAPQPH